MKFRHLKIGNRYIVGEVIEEARFERWMETEEVTPENHDRIAAMAKRAAESLSACANLKDETLTIMANGGNQNGNLEERLLMSALLPDESYRVWDRLRVKVAKYLAQHNGKA